MKQYKDFNLAQRLLLSFIQYLEKRLYQRKWTFEGQVAFARRQVSDDEQWLSHNNFTRKVCERHSKVLGDTWWTTPHESADTFRDKIGLNPHHKEK
jgi:predicted NAD/FAD-binding protein